MTKKLTKREHFALVRAAIDTHPLVDDTIKVSLLGFIDREVELLTRKSEKRQPDAKKVAEQRRFMDAIESTLAESDEPLRAGEIAKRVDTSVQRVTALTRKMVADGTVTREVGDKGVVTFTLT